MKTKLHVLLMSLLLPLMVGAQGWPANYGGVMLQGFYWDSYSETKWADLTEQSDELSKYFNLIWVPNSGMTSGFYHNSSSLSMGYDPCFWLNHNSCWGTEAQLREMINTFKAKGTGIIEDVVINHKNGLTNWCDFPNETWNGQEMTWSLADICRGDDGGNTANNGYQVTGANDTGDDFGGYRDLDHTSANVQKNVKMYLDYLLNDLGYVGFRYDMVKGYGAQYTKLYNESAEPEFSVGEYWDSKDNIYNWVNGTGKTSAAFDFGLKYTLNSAFGSGNWSALSDKGMAADINGYSRYSVTFVDNHDTYRDYNKLGSNVLAANAFILAMPGTPCIFWPHWKAYKNELKKMIVARKAAGITNQSTIIDQREWGGGYVTKVQGSVGTVLVISGYVTDYDTSGFVPVSVGTAANPNYAFYVSDNVDLGYLTASTQVTAEPGNYYPSVSTTLSATKSGATIVYTTDGTEPSATNGTQTSTATDFTFTETTTIKAGILYDDEVINVTEYTYNVSQSSLRIYARSTSNRPIYFYTYDPKCNGEWGEDNKINNTTTLKNNTWYYYDYDLKSNPNLRIIVRDANVNGYRYPADGQPGIKLDDIKNSPYLILDGNTLTYYTEEQLEQFGTYYLVSAEQTNGEQQETYQFQNVRQREDNEISPDLFVLTVKDADLKASTINYYVSGTDYNGKQVTYRPDSNFGLAMDPAGNNYNDQEGNNRSTPDYQSYDDCKQSNNYCFTLTKGKAASYTWTLNTSDAGNVGVTAEWHYDENKWYGYPYGKQSVALNLNRPIPDDEGGFYLFGNLKWDGSQWVWEADQDSRHKFTRDTDFPDSLVYYIDISNEGHPFSDLYLTVAPASVFNAGEINWNKLIRFQAQADKNATALNGGLTVPDDNGMGNKNQAFNPDIDPSLYDSYRLYINLSSATYGIMFKTSPYIVGTAVGTDFDTANALPLEWDDHEECYKYSGEFTNGGEFRLVVNQSYKLNWSEDDEAPAASATDGDYYNRLRYNSSDTDSEASAGGDRIAFNIPDGTYTLRFYMGDETHAPYYTIARTLPMRNMTCISNSSGVKLGSINEATRTIDGVLYNGATSWADNVAYAKPDGVDVYIVTGLDQSGDIYKVVLSKLETDYIPANVGVLLFTTNTPDNESDRYVGVEVQGYQNPSATCDASGNMLKAIITPLFLPGTVLDGNNEVLYRNFMFGYYRTKPYAEGTTERGTYDYKLGFWRSSVKSSDNPTTSLSSANMAYLSLTPAQYGTSELGLYDDSSDPTSAPYIHFTFEDDPLGVVAKEIDRPADNAYYTLQGVRVAARPLQRGVYIHNGKKIIIK